MILAKKVIKKITEKVNRDYKIARHINQHGIKVYPISEFELKVRKGANAFSTAKRQMFYIEVDNNGRKKVYDKILKSTDVNDAIWATINYYYKLLTEESKTNTKTK